MVGHQVDETSTLLCGSILHELDAVFEVCEGLVGDLIKRFATNETSKRDLNHTMSLSSRGGMGEELTKLSRRRLGHKGWKLSACGTVSLTRLKRAIIDLDISNLPKG